MSEDERKKAKEIRLKVEVFKVTPEGRRRIKDPIYLFKDFVYNFSPTFVVKGSDFLDDRDTKLEITKRFIYDIDLTLENI